MAPLDFLGLAGLLVAQFSLLWYRLGRVEGKLDSHLENPGKKKEA